MDLDLSINIILRAAGDEKFNWDGTESNTEYGLYSERIKYIAPSEIRGQPKWDFKSTCISKFLNKGNRTTRVNNCFQVRTKSM